MSLPVIEWAMRQHAPSASSKFVLVALAYAANHEVFIRTGEATAFPSVAALCAHTQQDRKTVFGNLVKLQARKLIEPVGTVGKTGQITRWRLLLDPKSTEFGTGTELGTGTESGTVPFLPANSAVFPSQASRNRDTEQVRNKEGTSKKAHTTRASAADLGSRLDTDWSLPAEWRAWAEANRPDIDIDATAVIFADYWRSQTGSGARKADWLATWRNWVRKERPGLNSLHAIARSHANLLHADKQFT